jgi:hypothetical protein
MTILITAYKSPVVVLLASPFPLIRSAALPGYPAGWSADALFQRRDGDFGAQRRFPRRQRQDDFQVMADDIEQRMRGDVDNQPQVAVRAAVFARRSLAFQADTLAVD